MKKIKKILLLTSMVIGLMAPVQMNTRVLAQENPALKDLSNHWSKSEVSQALHEGWVSGYPDNSFRPNQLITRAEFTKLLSSATHLKPDNAFTKELVNGSVAFSSTQDIFVDMNSHWLKQQGWLQPALSFGLLIATDYKAVPFNPAIYQYPHYRYDPNKYITRTEMAVMIDRALGLVYPAKQPVKEKIPFKDTLPDWAKGFIMQAYKSGVIQGYPDGTFSGGRSATRSVKTDFFESVFSY